MTNRPQIINLSIHPTILVALSLPLLKELSARLIPVGSCFARNTPAIEFFPLLVESRASRNFLAPSRLFIFLFLFSPPFLPLFLSSFPRSLSERKRGIYIYIYGKQTTICSSTEQYFRQRSKRSCRRKVEKLREAMNEIIFQSSSFNAFHVGAILFNVILYIYIFNNKKEKDEDLSKQNFQRKNLTSMNFYFKFII